MKKNIPNLKENEKNQTIKKPFKTRVAICQFMLITNAGRCIQTPSSPSSSSSSCKLWEIQQRSLEYHNTTDLIITCENVNTMDQLFNNKYMQK